MVTIQSPIAEILRDSPKSVGVFHRLGIDYCCGGKTPLNQACHDRGIDATDVLREVLSITDGETFGNLHADFWSADFLIDFIVANHHSYLRTVLPLAIGQMSKVVSKHGERFMDAPAILELLVELQDSLLSHLDDEERVLFSPTHVSLSAEELQKIVAAHESEHEEVGRKLQRLRAITSDFTPPEGACTTHRSAYTTIRSFYEDTMQHVYLENAVLFPQMLQIASTSSTTHH
jgi:regulator of cell morphogenesis and NO signaling